jgi:hypothetical protein
MDVEMRYLLGAIYLVMSASLLTLLADGGAGSRLVLLLRCTVWLIGTAGPLFCTDFTGRRLRSRMRCGGAPILE